MNKLQDALLKAQRAARAAQAAGSRKDALLAAARSGRMADSKAVGEWTAELMKWESRARRAEAEVLRRDAAARSMRQSVDAVRSEVLAEREEKVPPLV